MTDTVPLEDHEKLQKQYDTLLAKSTEVANQRDFYKAQHLDMLGRLKTLLVGVSPLVEQYTTALETYKPWSKNDDTPAG